MAEDCYFFIDLELDVPEDQRKLSVLCKECRSKKYPDTGWFYEGSTQGYGPYLYSCSKCNKVIYNGESSVA